MSEQGWRTEPPRPDEWDDRVDGHLSVWLHRPHPDSIPSVVAVRSDGACVRIGCGLEWPELSHVDEVHKRFGGEWCRMQGPPP